MQKILIDTDPGQDIDDLLAIHFALLRPELDIKAITTVTYPSDRRARLIKGLLRYMGRQDIPVAAGMQYPLRRVDGEEMAKLRDPGHSINHYAFAEPEDPADDPGSDDAVNLIIQTIEQHPGQLVLACIAPLTNIACALRKRPDLAGMIQSIALMGGEVQLNKKEHNIAFDYAASEIVLNSGAPIFMGTWDITRRFVLGKEECARFHRDRRPVCQALGRAIDLWYPAQSWKPGPVMYDLFPICWAFNRTWYTTRPMPVQVETCGKWTNGMTVLRGDRNTAEVTIEIQVDALREEYLRTVFG